MNAEGELTIQTCDIKANSSKKYIVFWRQTAKCTFQWWGKQSMSTSEVFLQGQRSNILMLTLYSFIKLDD